MTRRSLAPVLVLAVLLVPVSSAATVLTPTNWGRAGGQLGGAFGHSVAPAGDVDLDGFGDLLVGSSSWDGPPTNAGKATLFRGSPQGPSAFPAWEYVGLQAGAGTGMLVAPAGDVNNDGWPDVLVGSPLYNNGAAAVDAGRLDVFLGGPAGLPLAPQQTFFGEASGARFGFSAATAGDVDGDGYDDVIVGAPGHRENDIGEGAAYLFRGTAAGLVATSWKVVGQEEGAQLGFAVSGAGDVDADGYAEVIVGAPGRSFNFVREGFAFLYRGGAGGLATVAVSAPRGNSDNALYGAAVANAGDVNGDGYADVLIGAPGASVDETTVLGFAELHAGSASGLGGTLWGSYGGELNERFGSSVATAGDLNGDDHADFVVGAEDWPHPLDRYGRAQVWLGAAGAPSLDADLQGGATGDAFGFTVATAGDADGDGFSDLVVGAPGSTVATTAEGRLALWRGGASKPVAGAFWPQFESEANALFGFGIAGGVDAANQGVDALYLSAPLADQGFTDAGKIRVATAQIPSPVLNPGFVAAGTKAGMNFALELARAGDVDGDGREDLVVGSPNYFNGEGSEGLAQLFPGTASGLSPTATWTHESNLVGDRMGRGVAGGDFDADGFSDLLVGAWSTSPAGFDGRALVFRGSPAGPATAPSWTSPPSSGNSWFGFDVATGDFDGDGYDDALVGAPSASNGESVEGQVHVFFGGPAGLSLTPTWILEPNRAGTAFGYSVANAGDVDGDGVGDIVVGAPGYQFGGRAYVFRGSKSRSHPELPLARVLSAGVATNTFGNSVAGVGDVDKDGRDDILVGAPQHTAGQVNEGAVFLFRGSALGGDILPWWTVESNVVEARYGTTVARAGDGNGDGWTDFAVGATYQGAGGAVHVYHAGGTGRLFHATYQQHAAGGSYLRLGGTMPNGASAAAQTTLRSAAGRVRGCVEHQVGTQNEAWGGGARVVNGPYDTGAPGFFGTLAPVFTVFNGLGPGAAWRWRERSITRSPFFPHSPWRQPRAYETALAHFRTGGTNVAAGPPAAEGAAGAPGLAAIEPSPFRAGARVRFRLARAGDVRLDVHDARGRHVRSLVAGPLAAGEHAAPFDGRDKAGRPLAGGVYFVSLESAGTRATRKVVRLP